MAFVSNIQSWARKQGAPVSVGFLASLIAAVLINWGTAGATLRALRFVGFSNPLGIFTYPWAYLPLTDALGLIGLIFLGMWLLSVGGSVERDLGLQRYLLFLAAMIIIPPLVLGAVGAGIVLSGPWMAIGGLTVAWATRNPNSPIMLYGILPLSAKWIGLLTVAGTLLSYGFGNPLFGILACLHYAVAYAYASDRIPGLTYGRPRITYQTSRGQQVKDNNYFDDVRKREKERAERERLRKLFENSMRDDK